jgi:inner membrane protein
MAGLSRLARADAIAGLDPAAREQVVDVVLTPDPGVPICWAAILMTSAPAGELVLRRGTVALMPRWLAAPACVSRRLTFASPPAPDASRSLEWVETTRQPLVELRESYDRDCRARAWMEFGRAPVIRDGTILDLRFASALRANFTDMPLAPASGAARCPPFVPHWTPPRADLLEDTARARIQ